MDDLLDGSTKEYAFTWSVPERKKSLVYFIVSIVFNKMGLCGGSGHGFCSQISFKSKLMTY